MIEFEVRLKNCHYLCTTEAHQPWTDYGITEAYVLYDYWSGCLSSILKYLTLITFGYLPCSKHSYGDKQTRSTIKKIMVSLKIDMFDILFYNQ